MTPTPDRGQQLAGSLNIGEVTTWRLHWLLADLWSLKRDIAMATIGDARSLYAGHFAQLLERVKRAEGGYMRLRWETKTMLRFDYEDEVEPLFAALPKDAEFKAELATVKAQLQARADRALAAEADHVRASILNAGHALQR